MATDIIARGMATDSLEESKQYADLLFAAVERGVVYKGEVDYYNLLPSEAEVGWAYTVKYSGTSGTTPDGSEYVCIGKDPVEWGIVGPDMSALSEEISNLKSGKVDKEIGKVLSSNDYTNEEKEKLANLENYDDTGIIERIADIEEQELDWDNKSTKIRGYFYNGNFYSDDSHTQLITPDIKNIYIDVESGNIYDWDGERYNSLYYSKSEIDTKLEDYRTASEQSLIDDTKVDKETGKSLSSNDYTDEEKEKLANLENYDDTNISNRVTNIEEKESVWDNKLSDAPSDGKEYVRQDGSWVPMSLQLENTLTAEYTVGGVTAGTVFPKGTTLLSIITQILGGAEPVVTGYIYYGITDDIPTLEILNNPGDNDQVVKVEISEPPTSVQHGYNNGESYDPQVYSIAYPAELGDLISIIDAMQLDELNLYTKSTDGDYVIYYLPDSWTDSDYIVTFNWR